jgi:hypothetical protein
MIFHYGGERKGMQLFPEFGVALLALAYAGGLASRETAVDRVKIPAKTAVFWMTLGALVALWTLLTSDLPSIYWLYFALFVGYATAFTAFYP